MFSECGSNLLVINKYIIRFHENSEIQPTVLGDSVVQQITALHTVFKKEQSQWYYWKQIESQSGHAIQWELRMTESKKCGEVKGSLRYKRTSKEVNTQRAEEKQ